ncbi:uncharacterized protein LOC106939308 [Poecilia latipinna]|uniref:uncharacterized protein LOC106939308 n=1 Tax=Poecilia latipinna TaxID=48699 RepID=UPI00072EEDD5|nr:PREDICTED: uncharacterized protein LOC106939308 [Poecilia latipinna]
MIPSLFGRTETFIMLLFLLLLLIVSWAEAGYYGVVSTHTTKNVQGSSSTVVRRIKLSFSSCAELESWWCCTNKIDESSGEWCLKDYTWKITTWNFDRYWSGWERKSWIINRNDVTTAQFQITYEMKKRSDINRPNSSPQTNIIPFMRVPSNCQRNISLLTFDPDEDHVQCRYGSNPDNYECSICTAPSVLSLSSVSNKCWLQQCNRKCLQLIKLN